MKIDKYGFNNYEICVAPFETNVFITIQMVRLTLSKVLFTHLKGKMILYK